MDIQDKKIIIKDLFNSDKWNALSLVLKDKDDICLYIENAEIKIKHLVIPTSISAIHIINSSFFDHITIEGLENGKAINIDSCIQTRFGLVRIKNCSFNGFYLNDRVYKYNNTRNAARLSFDFEKCIIRNFVSYSINIPTFSNVCFHDKLKLIAHTDTSENSLIFKDCFFADYLKIEIENHQNLHFIAENTKNIPLLNTDGINTYIITNNVTFSSLEIKDSDLHDTNISLFRREIKEIDIFNSKLKILDIHTVDDTDAPKRIYNLSIKNSEISSFRLNNRKIIHPIYLENTLFHEPPQFHGSTIANGSVFPDRKSFLRTQGITDAACYRTLRIFMEGQRNREYEGSFFILEQDSLLNEIEGFRKYLTLRYLYKIISSYGTNYTRPIILFIISSIFFTLIYSLILSPSIDPSLPIDYKLLLRSFAFSLKQSLQPFFILKDVSLEEIKDNPLVIIVSIINSTISLTSIALSAFAISWKFKRG